MKTWTERLPGIIAFIESGNGLAKLKAKKELEEMAKSADEMDKLIKERVEYLKQRNKKINNPICKKCGTVNIYSEDDGYWCYECEYFYSK